MQTTRFEFDCWFGLEVWYLFEFVGMKLRNCSLGNQISAKKMHELSNLLAVGLLNLIHSLIMFTFDVSFAIVSFPCLV